MSNETVKRDAMVRMAAEQMQPVNTGEIAVSAAASESAAMVQARYVMALKNPRNIEQVRQDLLKECGRPSFALEDEEGKGNGALYRKPVGGGKFAEGLGIRFAEVALRCMRNNMADAFTVQETDRERVLHVMVLDLEANVSFGKTVHVSKTVERLTVPEGTVPISSRTNSAGKTTYLIPASEDALTVKEGALVSKTLRTQALRLIPGDIQDECISKIKEVRRLRLKEDPDAASRKIIDGMAKQNVTVTMLETYLEHPVSQCTSEEILNLQALYAGLRDGEFTWKEILDNADDARGARPKTKPEGETKTEPTRGVEAAKAKVTEAEKKKPADTKKTEPAKPAAAKPEPAKQPPAEAKATTDSEVPPWLEEPSESEPAQQTDTSDDTLKSKVAELAADGLGDELAGEPIVRVKPKNADIHGVTLPEFCDVAGYDEGPTQAQTEALVASFDDLCNYIGEKKSLTTTVKNFIGAELAEINGATVEALTLVFPAIKAKREAAKAK